MSVADPYLPSRLLAGGGPCLPDPRVLRALTTPLIGHAAPFLQRVAIDFQVHAADPHDYVPMLLSPYACTSYRGS